MGDIALPCFTFAKILRKPPKLIAEELVEKLLPTMAAAKEIADVQATNGYVNFCMDPDWAVRTAIPMILEEGYGQLPPQGMKMVLEHTSANPTDKLHVGRARNPILGDTLARICMRAGYEVETQYYVDDMGRQAVTLAYGRSLWGKVGEEEKAGFLGPYQYASHLMENEETKEELRGWLHALETQAKLDVNGTPLQEYVDSACTDIMETKITPALERANIHIHSFINESRFMKDGSVADVIEGLKERPEASQDDNGAWFIDMEPYGVKGRNTKFFFTRGDGTSLYATRDIAYHLWKYRKWDRVVNVLGEDHRLEAKQIAVCLELLGQTKKPEVVFYSFVSLPEGKMSTRKGTVVYFDDLLEEAVARAMDEVSKRRLELSEKERERIAEAVGVSAVRYNIIRVQPEKKMTFRWEDALSFEGDSAPFIQYSYARAASILRKGEDGGRDGDDIALLIHPSEITLIKHLAYLPNMVEECSESMRPHLMASYAHHAAMLFNQFYRDCPVLNADEELRGPRLALVYASKVVLAICLDLLGLTALEEM
ncbi:MAG: arginine--tRNA ligase [Thermoplasmata archaeon]|nr:arginine--tRNA ligase [Thermoplasmata archaeon]